MPEATEAPDPTDPKPDARKPVAGLILTWAVHEGDLDPETLQPLKTAPELGLFPPPGPREPLDALKYPFVIVPTAHWNKLQESVDASGGRDAWNAVGAVLQEVPLAGIENEDWNLPGPIIAARKLHLWLRDLSYEDRKIVLAEALFGPGGISSVEYAIADASAKVAGVSETNTPLVMDRPQASL